MTRIGQNTGTSKNLKKVRKVPINIDLIEESLTSWRGVDQHQSKRSWIHQMIGLSAAHQNLNSGSLRTKGRNSSFDEEGSDGPSLSGSNCGVRNPSSRLRL